MCGGGESSSLPCPCQDPEGSLSEVKAKSVSGQSCKGLLNAAACAEREKKKRYKKRDRLKMGSKTTLSALKDHVAPGCVDCFV